MKKRNICSFLMVIVYLTVFPVLAFSQESQSQFTERQIEYVYIKYKNHEEMLNKLFCDDSAIGYWHLVREIEKNSIIGTAIDWSSMIIEEYPQKEEYAKVLMSLITMQEGDFLEQIEVQSQFDDLKDAGDYISDIVGIATSFAGGGGASEDLFLVDVVEGVSDFADLVDDRVGYVKYYQASIQNYAHNRDFLEAIRQYAENKELRDVADSFIAANKALLEKRLELLTDTTESIAKFEAKLFFEKFSYELLKKTDLYESDDTVKFFVDYGEKLKNSISSMFSLGEFTFRMVILAGDIGFGTSDTFYRYQEMKILADIADAIVEANSRIQVSKDTEENAIPDRIQAKCDYYNMLLVTHARGEYLIYQLLANDASLLSDIRLLSEAIKRPGVTTDSWYHSQIECLAEYAEILSNMFSVPSDKEIKDLFSVDDIPEDAVEFNGHYYYLYDVSGLADASKNTWENALGFCDGANGYLATITSKEENDFLFSYMNQCGYSSAYFGLTDRKKEGQWEWCNGETVSYTNWNQNEPGGGANENYGMFYWKYEDGTWNDGDFKNGVDSGGSAFLCEWGSYSSESENEKRVETISKTSPEKSSEEREIVLVLDVSGSMEGTPISETKKAATNFIRTILQEDAGIGIVTYDESASIKNNFSMDENRLKDTVSSLKEGGGTNIEAGLSMAYQMLQKSDARKKIVVLMSDGIPNNGKVGEDLILFADEMKEKDVIIYTLGFFESLSSKSEAQYLMEHIASDGCHYEVEDADDLVFFFGDIADQINGQKYIYVRIACPVDVTVTFDGETLNSDVEHLNTRTGFGSLTFEENDSTEESNRDQRIKILRLKEDMDYEVHIEGTGRGKMNYTIGFMDENGKYSDLRRFVNIKITKNTLIDTVASNSETTVLNVDEDGDGKYDLKYKAEENSRGEIVDYTFLLFIVVGVLMFLILLFIAIKIKKRFRKN